MDRTATSPACPPPASAPLASAPLASVPLAESERDVFARFAQLVDLAGRDVVEVGGAVPADLLAPHAVRSWHAVDPRHRPGRAGVRQLHHARAERLPLPDRSVDAVFSCNAFQFVGVEAVLAEARRVLRPGGVLYAHFGPVWNAPDGHQLEYVTYRGRDLVFWRDTLLPAWAHLRFDRAQLRAVLATAIDTELADLLVAHVHDSTTVNRLFFEDYVRLAVGSALECVEISASGHLDYPIVTPPYRHPLLVPVDLAELTARVSRRCGGHRQLGIRDVRLILRRASWDAT